MSPQHLQCVQHACDHLERYLTAWEGWTPQAILKSHKDGMLGHHGGDACFDFAHHGEHDEKGEWKLYKTKPNQILYSQIAGQKCLEYITFEEILSELDRRRTNQPALVQPTLF